MLNISRLATILLITAIFTPCFSSYESEAELRSRTYSHLLLNISRLATILLITAIFTPCFSSYESEAESGTANDDEENVAIDTT